MVLCQGCSLRDYSLRWQHLGKPFAIAIHLLNKIALKTQKSRIQYLIRAPWSGFICRQGIISQMDKIFSELVEQIHRYSSIEQRRQRLNLCFLKSCNRVKEDAYSGFRQFCNAQAHNVERRTRNKCTNQIAAMCAIVIASFDLWLLVQ